MSRVGLAILGRPRPSRDARPYLMLRSMPACQQVPRAVPPRLLRSRSPCQQIPAAAHAAASLLRKPVLFQHPRHGLRQGGAKRGRYDFLGVDGTMQVAELAFGISVAAGGFEPTLEHSGGAGPLGPVALDAIGGLDERAQGAITEKAFDRGGIFRAYDRDELLLFARFHGQVL